MNKLEKSLKNWVSNGLINQNQADQIYQFETTHPQISWVLSSLLILGILIIGLGIISVIAANWDQIPAVIKLIIDFLFLIVLSGVIIISSSFNKEMLFETLLLLFIILCLASIGLINQIYHTGGELYQALMLWSLITLPTAMASRHTVIPWIWYGGFLFGLVSTCYQSPNFQFIFQDNYFAVAMMIPLLCAFLALVSKRFISAHHFTDAFQSWFYISGIVAVIIADYNSFFTTFTKSIFIAYQPSYLLALLIIFTLMVDCTYRKIQKIILFLTLIVFLMSFHLPMLTSLDVLHALFAILTLGLLAIFVVSLQKRKLFQFLLFCVGLRFLGLYFQALGGLALTGVGLIISGLLIVTMAVLWNKYRNAITLWTERWLHDTK